MFAHTHVSTGEPRIYLFINKQPMMAGHCLKRSLTTQRLT